MNKWFVIAIVIVMPAALFAGRLFFVKCTVAAEEPQTHTEHAEEKVVSLTPEQIEANGIEIAEAGPGEIAVQLTLPGEIKLNADRVAHVIPRVGGVAREVFKNAGDTVTAGEVMAILDSRELAMMKAAYLAARERESLARSIFEREKGLWEKKISAEQDYLAAKQALAEAAINTRSAEQQLHAIGCSEEYIESLPSQAHVAYTHHEITAPFDGVVIEKHITLGESLKDDVSCFTIADLSTVWIDLSVYQKDIPSIVKGQEVKVAGGAAEPEGLHGHIEYIGPVMGEDTRTVIARAVMPNE
ncbi:MAG TPA: efflux RND transporter periplasmic adaptor subunit, partial [Candidatus Hydrogenedentes bacterium]|nr:efflux RND transporter periplasmic adaptor subunit [Candidatus Hydrogenedentota bacterium]